MRLLQMASGKLYILVLVVGAAAGFLFTLGVEPLVTIRPGREAAFLLTCVGAGMLAALVILLGVERVVLKPLQSFVSAAEDLAAGKLDWRLPGRYSGDFKRLSESLHGMVRAWCAIIEDLQKSSNQILDLSKQLTSTLQQMHGATEEVSSTIQGISKGAEEQASKVQEAFELIDAMAGNIQHSAETVSATEKAVHDAREVSERGSASVQSALTRMLGVRDVVLNSAKKVNELGTRSKAIGQIVEVITNIADQTNLLALNAAIEAARAGEYGRGFAVVAEEVKKLADGSADAAQRISRMIREIQKEINEVVLVMNTGAEQVEKNTTAVTQAGEALASIRAATEEAGEQMKKVSRSFEQQADQAGKVVEAITNIVAVSEENASATQEISASTEELTASMESLVAAAHQLQEVAGRLSQAATRFRVSSQRGT